MARKNLVPDPHMDESLPNTLTITGSGELVNFEITTDGEISMLDDTGVEDAIVVSHASAEGALVDDILQFGFSGSITNCRIIDEDGTVDEDASAYPSIVVDTRA